MEEQIQWYRRYLQDPQSLHFMAIKRVPEDIELGYCQLLKIDSHEKSAEFGLVVGADHIGSGIGFKYAVTFMKICLSYLTLRAIYGSNHPQNDVSNRFHRNHVGSELIEGPHKYRKGNQLLFKVEKTTFESFEEKLLLKSRKWKDILNIEQIKIFNQ